MRLCKVPQAAETLKIMIVTHFQFVIPKTEVGHNYCFDCLCFEEPCSGLHGAPPNTGACYNCWLVEVSSCAPQKWHNFMLRHSPSSASNIVGSDFWRGFMCAPRVLLGQCKIKEVGLDEPLPLCCNGLIFL